MRRTPATRPTRFLEAVLDAAESLARLSSRGRIVPEIQEENVRELFVYSYRLIYEVDTAEVRVLTVIHGARDFAAWLERQETS